MPVNPINIAARAAQSTNKIEPGRVLEYEQHSRPILAVALQEKRSKWAVLNQQGAELELAADRLFLLPGNLPDSNMSGAQKVAFLQELNNKANELVANLNLAEVWEVLLGEVKETSVEQVAEIVYSKNTLEFHLAARRALLADEIYFKRRKQGFEPRPENVVQELQAKVRAEKEKQERREQFFAAILAKLSNPKLPVPTGIEQFELLAALGKTAPEAKESKELLEEVFNRAKLNPNGKLEDKAFQLLVSIGHFTPDQDLNIIRMGRPTAFEPEVLSEVQDASGQVNAVCQKRLDLSGLTTLTIDGAETKDFDDALSLEVVNGRLRVGIHISDVSSVVAPDSVTEKAAVRRATSVYCPDYLIPMLPPILSEDLLSLVESKVRPVLSFFIEFDETLQIVGRSLCEATIEITKRLTYEEADQLLCQEPPTDSVYADLLLQLWNIASASEAKRLAAGALQFGRKELNAKVTEGGKVTLEDANEDTPARRLVSEMMILANETAALYAKESGFPLVFRTQEPPDVELGAQGLDIPDGPAREYFRRSFVKRSLTSCSPAPHSGLGLEAYTQVTSPIRRAVDMANQRQVASFCRSGKPFYTAEKLNEKLLEVEVGLDEAIQIQRERNRYWLLRYLLQEKIREIGAVILRVDGVRPLAELDIVHSLYPFTPAQGKGPGAVSRSDLGRRIKLRIEHIDPRTLSIGLKEIV